MNFRLAGCEASHFATDDTGCIRRYVGGDRKSIGFYELKSPITSITPTRSRAPDSH